jgi:murein DD-endopeptidase MepM/ murein hydrolase activator NlpD
VSTVNDVASSAKTIIAKGLENGADLAVKLVSCADCGEAIEPWRARPFVSGHIVKLRCVDCARSRRATTGGGAASDAPAAIPLGGGTSVATARARRLDSLRPSRRAMVLAAWGVLGVGGVGTLAAAVHNPAVIARAPRVDVADELSPASLPPDPALAADALSAVAGAIASAVDAHKLKPHVGQFVHPLPGPELILPGGSDAMFGADRPGDRPAECGGGHCGVDLVAEMGAPVVAVEGGTVVQIDDDADNERGGRFVKVEHVTGMASWYFHLDHIRSDLSVGDKVAAGELLGTVGRTGNKFTPTHLHFAITVAREDGEHHIDPLPYLERATVIPQATLASAH